MDHHRFDRISRRLAASLSRRQAIAGFLGIVAIAGDDPVAAARATCRRPGASCTRTNQCCDGICLTAAAIRDGFRPVRSRRNRCVCQRPTPDACGGACVDTFSNRQHCGACDNVCADGLECAMGKCIRICDLRDGITGCITRTDNTVQDVCIDDVYWGDFVRNRCVSDADCSTDDVPAGAIAVCVAGIRIDWPALGQPTFHDVFVPLLDETLPYIEGECIEVSLPNAQSGLCPI